VKSPRTSALGAAAFTAAAIFVFTIFSPAQERPGPAAASNETADAVRDLQDQVRQLRGLVEEMRAENQQSRTEMRQLRHDLETTRALLQQPANGEVVAKSVPEGGLNASAQNTGTPASLEDRVQKLEDSTALMGSKIDEQYQTKVETASKYRARLHGIVLMNAFRNVGNSDDLDFPNYAEAVGPGTPVANAGATLRQSEIGLEVFGPNVAGARTSANVQFDFSGGFPAVGNGVNFGIVRLQTANLRFDWEHTSVVAGQDSLFISPLSPTSFSSLATPALAFAGNLWGWTPQLRLEHRFSLSDQQTVTMQAGVFDNLNWEPPYNPYYRTLQAGELSGQPAYGFRTSWSRPVQQHPLSFGVAGYYGRQNWRWDRIVDAWSVMADWQVPIAPRLSLSGEVYRGSGIGGLGAAVGTSIVYGGDFRNPFTPIRGVDTAGGWTQLKLQLTPKLEVNGVVSQDDALTANIRGFATDLNNFGEIIGRNRGALGNVVFRPRSDLILSAELKRLRTFPVYSSSTSLNQVNLSVGILF
jgi:hypothetical protein